MSAVKKPGRPKLRVVTFRVDEPTWEAIQRLEAAVSVSRGVVQRGRRRSLAIRDAVLEKDAKLRGIS